MSQELRGRVRNISWIIACHYEMDVAVSQSSNYRILAKRQSIDFGPKSMERSHETFIFCVGWPASCNGGDYETLNDESLDARQGPRLTPPAFCSTCRAYVRDGIGTPAVRWRASLFLSRQLPLQTTLPTAAVTVLERSPPTQFAADKEVKHRFARVSRDAEISTH